MPIARNGILIATINNANAIKGLRAPYFETYRSDKYPKVACEKTLMITKIDSVKTLVDIPKPNIA